MSTASGVPRLRKLTVDELDSEQRALYDAIAAGPRAQGPQAFALVDDAGRLEGPFNAMLLNPRLGGALQQLGAAARFGSGLPARCIEIAILTVAHHWASDFEIHAHEALGRSIGLSGDELAALATGRGDAFSDPLERLVAATVSALVAEQDLDDRHYAEAQATLGAVGLFELMTIVGYYATLALQLRVFRVPRPA